MYNIAMLNRLNSLLFIIPILLFFSFGFYTNAMAADLINAETLSSTWYSIAKINEGDIININAGNRIVQIKILNIEQVAPKTSMEKVNNIANTVVNKGNQYADTLANYVESLKTPTENSPDSARQDLADTTLSFDQNKIQGQVLGASTENISVPTSKNILQKLPFYNPLLNLVAFLIHQWIWVLFAILLFILYLKFT